LFANEAFKKKKTLLFNNYKNQELVTFIMDSYLQLAVFIHHSQRLNENSKQKATANKLPNETPYQSHHYRKQLENRMSGSHDNELALWSSKEKG
jgi:cell division protein FtsN